jgi:Rps23 Pro-64 3,4-dihydroxylase Tpa1-like proline 4-hydroxylase
MQMYQNIYQKLITYGWHIGSIQELFNEHTGVTEQEFDYWRQIFLKTGQNKNKHYVYRHNFIAQNNPESYINKPGYTGPIPTPEESLQEVPMNRVEHRKKFVKDVITGGATEIRTTQQWSRLDMSTHTSDLPLYNMQDFFETLIRKHTSLIYPELMAKKDTFKMATGFSMYEDGDFSEVHYDGINPGRACVIIIYYAEPSTWKEGDGGELLVCENAPKLKSESGITVIPTELSEQEVGRIEKCIPVYGNYAIMDFSKFNIGHSIERVNNNFQRYTQQTFVGP